MLHLYIYGKWETPEEVIPYGMEIVNDVDLEFSVSMVEVTETAKRIVKDVDDGTLVSPTRFTNKLGLSLRVDDLSTGSKAGILVDGSKKAHKVINLEECGINAITAILIHCRECYAVTYDIMGELELDRDLPLGTPIDVMTEDGAHLKTVKEFNGYMRNDRVLPDLSAARERWLSEQTLLRQQNEKK